ncbi:MAG TPA: (2Fe-2S) ferredoxin domain-containing protein [Candidatus Thermoplasmatota archaeon]|nr:(2Fe-2S) ferredoxin domain-containing protein [Candidatus Thermoplasmatota archaeon]
MTVDQPYEKMVFVCTKGAYCPRDGPALQVHLILKQGIKDTPELRDDVRINHSGCLNQCGHGPMMVVYPEGVWYSHVDEAGAKRILEEHLKGGKPVEEYRYRAERKGGNKTDAIKAEDKAKKAGGGAPE